MAAGSFVPHPRPLSTKWRRGRVAEAAAVSRRYLQDTLGI